MGMASFNRMRKNAVEKAKEVTEAVREEPPLAQADIPTLPPETDIRAEAEALGLKPQWNAKAETIQKMIDRAKKAQAMGV